MPEAKPYAPTTSLDGCAYTHTQTEARGIAWVDPATTASDSIHTHDDGHVPAEEKAIALCVAVAAPAAPMARERAAVEAARRSGRGSSIVDRSILVGVVRMMKQRTTGFDLCFEI